MVVAFPLCRIIPRPGELSARDDLHTRERKRKKQSNELKPKSREKAREEREREHIKEEDEEEESNYVTVVALLLYAPRSACEANPIRSMFLNLCIQMSL